MVAHYSVLTAMEKPTNAPANPVASGASKAASNPDKSRKFEQEMDKVQTEPALNQAKATQDEQPTNQANTQGINPSGQPVDQQALVAGANAEAAQQQSLTTQNADASPSLEAAASNITKPSQASQSDQVPAIQGTLLADLAAWQALEKQATKHQQGADTADQEIDQNTAAANILQAQRTSEITNATGPDDKPSSDLAETNGGQTKDGTAKSTEVPLSANQPTAPNAGGSSPHAEAEIATEIATPVKASDQASDLAANKAQTPAGFTSEKVTIAKQEIAASGSTSNAGDPIAATKQASRKDGQPLASDPAIMTELQAGELANIKAQDSKTGETKTTADQQTQSHQSTPPNAGSITTEARSGADSQQAKAQTTNEQPLTATSSSTASDNVPASTAERASAAQAQPQAQTPSQPQAPAQPQAQTQSPQTNMQAGADNGTTQAQNSDILASQKLATQDPSNAEKPTGEPTSEERTETKLGHQSDKPASVQPDRQEQLAKLRAPKGTIFSNMMAGISTGFGNPTRMEGTNDLFDPMAETDPMAMNGNDRTVRLTGLDAFARTGQMPNSASLANAQAIAAQITRHAGRGENRFEIRLDPAELGKIDVRLTIGSDGQARAICLSNGPKPWTS